MRMGLCYNRKKLAWTSMGFGWWMPEFVKRFIVKVWNRISCAIYGHYWFPDSDPKNGAVWRDGKLFCFESYVCCDCCKRTNDGIDKKNTQKIYKEKDHEIV